MEYYAQYAEIEYFVLLQYIDEYLDLVTVLLSL